MTKTQNGGTEKKNNNNIVETETTRLLMMMIIIIIIIMMVMHHYRKCCGYLTVMRGSKYHNRASDRVVFNRIYLNLVSLFIYLQFA